MSLEQTATKVIGIMSGVDMVYIVHPNEREAIDVMLGIARTDLDKLANGEEVIANKEDTDKMHNALNFCKRLVIDEPVTERLAELVEGICLMTHNWNVNVGKDGTIHKDVKFLNSAMKQHFTIAQAIEILKRILGKFENLNYGCDNINSISAHYLEALDKIHEVTEDDCQEDRCI
jgi:hypothetical protein